MRDALRYIEKTSRIDSRGDSFYTADNPPFGATITYYLKDEFKSKTDQRLEAEKAAAKAKADPRIPSFDELRAEDEELDPTVVLTIRDASGAVVRRIEGPNKKGIQRATWDLRYPSSRPTDISPPTDRPPWEQDPMGPLVVPGTYTVTLSKSIDGVLTELAGPQEFEVVALDLAALPGASPAESLAFEQQVAGLQRALGGAVKVADEVENRLAHLRKAILDTPAATPDHLAEARRLQTEVDDIQIALVGDPTKEERNVFTPPSISERVYRIIGSQLTTTQGPTITQRDAYGWAGEAFTTELDRLTTLIANLEAFEGKLELAGAPGPRAGFRPGSPNSTRRQPMNQREGLRPLPFFLCFFFFCFPLAGQAGSKKKNGVASNGGSHHGEGDIRRRLFLGRGDEFPATRRGHRCGGRLCRR